VLLSGYIIEGGLIVVRNKAAVFDFTKTAEETLVELFNNAKITGVFGKQEDFEEPMTIKEAREVLEKNPFVGHHRGRTISVFFNAKQLNLMSYAKINENKALETVIENLGLTN
jgi:hypothetical protein